MKTKTMLAVYKPTIGLQANLYKPISLQANL